MLFFIARMLTNANIQAAKMIRNDKVLIRLQARMVRNGKVKDVKKC